jgi:hypothetical protein
LDPDRDETLCGGFALMVPPAVSGMARDEIVDLTGYPADRVPRILQDAGISEPGTG